MGRSEWVDRLRAVAPDRAVPDLKAAVDAAVVANAAAPSGSRGFWPKWWRDRLSSVGNPEQE